MKTLLDEIFELDEQAIALLKQRGSADAPSLALALGISPQAARRMMERLKAQHRVHEERAGRFVTYVYGGNVVQKREPIEYKPFTGVNWANSTMRPGCQDFLNAPSLVQGEQVPHRAPMHGCVSSAARFAGEAK
jgi:hypothetical protein